MAIKTYTKGKAVKLSDNFKSTEFDCHGSGCCSSTLIDSQLVDYLQKIRTHFGKAVNVNSAYRCDTHNKKVGGGSNSYHKKGQAADIKVSGIAPAEVAKYAESIGILGIGLYETDADGYFVHVDTRTKKAFWYGQKQASRTTFGGAVNQEETPKINFSSLKYNDKNKPIVCMQTNSTCYKSTKVMTPVGILWHSTGANNPSLSRFVQPLNSDANYNEMIQILGKNKYNNDYNHASYQSGLNAWIGKLANGDVATVQTMPWNYRPWGCGSGTKGSCNNGWIQFEICEDSLNDKTYFDKIYKEACEITAYLCKLYDLNPYGTVQMNGVNIPVILCHAESYKLGFGSNHADVLHWFKNYGKTMDDVRNDVAALMNGTAVQETPTSKPTIEEEEEVTQEQFNVMMNNWIAEQAKKAPGDWSADAREWGERNGLINGDASGNKMYKKIITREEFIAVLYRALHRNFID